MTGRHRSGVRVDVDVDLDVRASVHSTIRTESRECRGRHTERWLR